jgi:hypothetical protein
MLNPCRCGSPPLKVETSTGLIRISCAMSQCDDIVCARELEAERVWNEQNPRRESEREHRTHG